ncbi:hypothetical protein HDV00_005184 [Rhizophlyctis rosea]|nr:hypothetical protein HDV00_005184 [Rhizophlyctis rosea]
MPGSLRVKLKYSVSSVLPLENYRPFLDLIATDSFRLAHLFGKVSKDREEGAMCFIKLMEASNRTQEFLGCIVSSEVEETSDPNTLFRANSMASKAIDVYMKYLGLPYLRQTIGPIIKHIVSKKIQLELDPTRVDKQDELKKNRKALLEWNKKILDAIWDARGTVPSPWRPVFCHIQTEVKNKFPQDEAARYTCVGGFVFLRFFAPAILGPKLFGIIDEYVDPKTSRTLTLLAKTLQTLANLVNFGPKESYMMELNGFIGENLDRMKVYIDGLATKEAVVKKEATLHHVHFEVAREAARLYHFYVRASPLILQTMKTKDAPLIRELAKLLTKLTLETTAADADADNKFAFPALKKSYALLLDLRTQFEDTINRMPDYPLENFDSDATLGSLGRSQSVAIVDTARPREERVVIERVESGDELARPKGPVFSTVSIRQMDSSSIMASDSYYKSGLMSPIDSESGSTRPSRVGRRRESAVDDLDAALATLAASMNDKSGENSRRASVLEDGGPSWRHHLGLGPPSTPLPPLPSGGSTMDLVGTPSAPATALSKGVKIPAPGVRVEKAEAGQKISGPPPSAPIPEAPKLPLPEAPKLPLPETLSEETPRPSIAEPPATNAATSDIPAARPRGRKARGAAAAAAVSGTSSPNAAASAAASILSLLSTAKEAASTTADNMSSRGSCKGCSETVRGDNCVEFQGCVYHKEHFVCNKCMKPLEPGTARGKGGIVYCLSDYLARYPPDAPITQIVSLAKRAAVH